MASQDAKYPIRTVAARTGLSPHVLRAWERRYDVVAPSREGGSRLYSESDIERLRVLHRLTSSGFQIGQVAQLPFDELKQLLASSTSDRQKLADAHPLTSELDGLEQAIRALDANAMYSILKRAALIHPLHDFVDRLLVPILHRTGEMWSSAEVCPAHEHLLSTQVARVLDWLAESMIVSSNSPVVIAATPGGHRHVFGAQIAALSARAAEWNVVYLGADLPANDIAAAARARRASAVVLSATYSDDAPFLPDELARLKASVPPDTLLFVGGSVARENADLIDRAGATVVDDFAILRDLLVDARRELGERARVSPGDDALSQPATVAAT